jgi:hypothetical protein
MNEHYVNVYQIRVVPRDDVVRNHEASKLVNVEVAVSEGYGVGLVLKEKNTSKNVRTNRKS